MKEEEIVFSLIKKDLERKSKIAASRLLKLASMMNITTDKYQKVVERLIEDRKIVKSGYDFVLA